MASRSSRSPYRDLPGISPEIPPERYDPFDPPFDPVEMQNFSTPSWEPRVLGEGPQEPQESQAGLSRTRSGASFVSSLTGESSGQAGYAPIPPAHYSMSRMPPQKSVTSSGNTFGTGITPSKTIDPDTQALVERRAGEIAQWHIHWETPAIILVLFVAGLMGAVGHHLFYTHLDGKPAVDQLLMIRYGTALAFFTKSTLVGSVVMSYRQRIWHTFRKKAMTISAIDGLFAVTENPTEFRKWEMLRNAKLASFMAVASWLIPIAAVLSPASLTSEVKIVTNNTHCPEVASLNFTHESVYNFRNGGYYPGSSLVYYNSTDVNATQPGWFDYYDQPSKIARRLTITSAYLQKPVSYPDAALQSCGDGWNCTYTISFQGPGYNCEEVANSTNPNNEGLLAMHAPFNTSSLAPAGTFIYLSNVDMGEYANPQTPTNSSGEPAEGPPYPENLGVFLAEPVLWIGYSINTTIPYDPSSPYYSRWGAVHEPKMFKCTHYQTNYTLEQRYKDEIQNSVVKNRTFISPIVDTTVSPNPENKSDLIITPSNNYVRPTTDVGKYKLTAAYHAMGSLLRNFLRGTINHDSKYPLTTSDISETRLIDSRTSYPVSELMGSLQSFYEDMIITLLSEPHLIVASSDSVLCEKTRSVNVFVYHAEGLWIGYAIVVVFTFVFLVVGAWSIHQNGVASDTQFSRIMVTTRNPTIDRLSVGACLGGDPFPPELIKTKLKFGVLLEDEEALNVASRGEGPLGRVEHCTFGTTGETKEIVKYGVYAGLKRWRKGGKENALNAEEKEGLLTNHD